MNCLEAQDQLHQMLDGEPLRGDAPVHAHLQQCDQCRGLFQTAGMMQASLQTASMPFVSPDLTSTLVQLGMNEHQRKHRSRRRWAGAVALAAAILVAVLIPRLIPPRSTNPLAVTVKIELPQEKPTLREAVSQVSNALTTRLTQTTDSAVAKTRDLLPRFQGPKFSLLSFAATTPPSKPPVAQADSGVTRGLKPMARSAKRAFSFFLRELPAMPGAKPEL